MSDLHFFLNLYPLLPKNDNKKILNNFRLKLIMSMGQDRLLGAIIAINNGAIIAILH